jgi:monoamine oxidase
MNRRLERESVIIIGGGAAGLNAARTLLENNFKVVLLEAGEKLGGRVATLRGGGFSYPVECGVEFVHGRLPATLSILKEGNIAFHPVKGKMFSVKSGKLKHQQDFSENWDLVMEKMNAVREDMSMQEFLDRFFFGPGNESTRASVRRFAEGFDLADISIASVLSLREEWMSEEDEQYRIPGGYDQVIDHLEKINLAAGLEIFTSQVVSKVEWQKDRVTVFTEKQQTFHADKLLVTVSLGVLQAKNREKGSIEFSPKLHTLEPLFPLIGFGNVVRMVIEFKENFWEKFHPGLGFLLSEEIIPTWWTQLPAHIPLLTGWAGGPQALPLENFNETQLMDAAMRSLSHIFDLPETWLRENVVASVFNNWKLSAFTRGAYSYDLVGSQAARHAINPGVEGTIYFAGEAFYNGPAPGTLEAALVSGREMAERIAGK